MYPGRLAEGTFAIRMMWAKQLIAGALVAGLLALTLATGALRSHGHSTGDSGPPAYLRGVRIVEVQPIGRRADKMIGIPESALIHDSGTARVWVLDTDGGLALRRVETGRCSGDFIETVRGLKLGDRVIARGILFEASSTLNPGESRAARGVLIADARCNRGATVAVRPLVPDESRPE